MFNPLNAAEISIICSWARELQQWTFSPSVVNKPVKMLFSSLVSVSYHCQYSEDGVNRHWNLWITQLNKYSSYAKYNNYYVNGGSIYYLQGYSSEGEETDSFVV